MKRSSIITLIILITFVCFGQETLVSQSGNIDPDTKLSEFIAFSITEPSFLRVKGEAPGFSPVVSFDPEIRMGR